MSNLKKEVQTTILTYLADSGIRTQVDERGKLTSKRRSVAEGALAEVKNVISANIYSGWKHQAGNEGIDRAVILYNALADLPENANDFDVLNQVMKILGGSGEFLRKLCYQTLEAKSENSQLALDAEVVEQRVNDSPRDDYQKIKPTDYLDMKETLWKEKFADQLREADTRDVQVELGDVKAAAAAAQRAGPRS